MICELQNIDEALALGLPTTEDYKVFKCIQGGSTVYFSGTRQGNAMSIHLAADRTGKRILRSAVDEFCDTIFSNYEWCEVILGVVGKKSVVNLAEKCGFSIIGHGKAKVNGETQDATVVGRWP